MSPIDSIHNIREQQAMRKQLICAVAAALISGAGFNAFLSAERNYESVTPSTSEQAALQNGESDIAPIETVIVRG
jgi:hypothetical protein